MQRSLIQSPTFLEFDFMIWIWILKWLIVKKEPFKVTFFLFQLCYSMDPKSFFEHFNKSYATKTGVHNSNLMANQNFFWHIQGTKLLCFNTFKERMFLSKKEAKFGVSWARLKASAGHIWPAGRMLCMPALKALSYVR